uniref:Uncharacterized protein n=1 Tax=Chaetophora sp. FACHB-2423 TaxID=2725789 RepID=A0A6H1XDY5_9CHLO|nr:hypothetical protein [Chaetophora sp. FACHB-2423]
MFTIHCQAARSSSGFKIPTVILKGQKISSSPFFFRTILQPKRKKSKALAFPNLITEGKTEILIFKLTFVKVFFRSFFFSNISGLNASRNKSRLCSNTKWLILKQKSKLIKLRMKTL